MRLRSDHDMSTGECIMTEEIGEGRTGAGDRVDRETWRNRCVPLTHQVAGHKYGIDKVGILQHPDGTVLKQLQAPPRGPREMSFYSQVYAQDCSDPQLLALQRHLPKYYGTWASSESPNELYLKLEDVTHGYIRPCIMDVKMGRRSYDPFASQEKREEYIRKYPLMEEIGFLLLGMRVYQVTSKSYISHDQRYGRSLVKETLKSGLAQFFHNGKELRKDAVSLSIHKVRSVLRWFESQKQLHFYASSLLLVYEGSPPPSGRTGEPSMPHEPEHINNNNHAHLSARAKPQGLHCSPAPHSSACRRPSCNHLQQDFLCTGQEKRLWPPAPHNLLEQDDDGDEGRVEVEIKWMEEDEGMCSGFGEGSAGGEAEGDVEVRMIDFAHVFPSDSPDEGYMYGLRNLLSVLEEILQD